MFLYWLLVVSKVLFSSLCRLFSGVHKHCLEEYSKCRAYQTLFKITHIVIKPLKKIDSINSLSRWGVTLLKFLRKFGACQKLEPAGRIGDFGHFLNCFAESTRASMVLSIEWMQFVLKNCEILHFVRGLYDKNSAS